MINGIAGAALPRTMRDELQVRSSFCRSASAVAGVARTVRGSTMVERDKE